MMYKRLKQHKYFPHLFCLLVIVIVLLFVLICCKNAYSQSLIIDTHEHIESAAKADELFKAMKDLGIAKTILVASPIETLTLNGNHTFTKYEDNNNEILNILKKYPDNFIPFCTISPLGTNALVILQDCINKGGKGIKLYNGHSYYYDTFGITLDSPVMDPIYAYAEKNRLPILYHVNIQQYGTEFLNVLKKFPNLTVSIPHYMVSSSNINEARQILDSYPNTFTDISFGNDPFMAQGFLGISNNIKLYKDFFDKYSNRILFGADLVLTTKEKKDQKYMETYLQCYKDLLEKKSFTCSPVSSYYKSEMEKNKAIYDKCPAKNGKYCKKKLDQADTFMRFYNKTKNLNGLDLNEDTLKKIYTENPARFLSDK